MCIHVFDGAVGVCVSGWMPTHVFTYMQLHFKTAFHLLCHHGLRYGGSSHCRTPTCILRTYSHFVIIHATFLCNS